jgi:hypothetical protein
MTIGRRGALKIVAGGIVATVAGPAEALGARDDAPRQATLVGCGLSFVWSNLLDDDAKNVIRTHFSNAVRAIGRTVDAISNSVALAEGIHGNSAMVSLSIRKHADSHLIIGARMDYKGASMLPYSGTAPHHNHPHVRMHAEQIVRKMHKALRDHNM